MIRELLILHLHHVSSCSEGLMKSLVMMAAWAASFSENWYMGERSEDGINTIQMRSHPAPGGVGTLKDYCCA